MSKPNDYRELHRLLNKLPRYTYPYPKEKVSGVYVFFENGERYQGYDRAVWVGTHFQNNRLFNRVDDHFGINQRLSMLRKHIGRCLLLRQSREEYLPLWNTGILSKELRKNRYPQIDWVLEGELEEQISELLQLSFSFVIIPAVPDFLQRQRWAAGLIATLAQSKERCSSEGWLGHLHPHAKIRAGKLWNFQYHQSQPLTREELTHLKKILSNTTR